MIVHIDYLYGQKGSSNHYGKHAILSEEPHPNSLAGYILMKKMYIVRDNRHVSNWRAWLRFRNKWLKNKKKENKGNLVCEYCGRENLIINHGATHKNKLKATIDHIMPLSKGGAKFDESNLAVSCYDCNHKKADRVYCIQQGVR